MSASSYSIFAQSAPGLEAWLHSELTRLGVTAKEIEGGAEFRGSEEDLWRVSLSSRLCESLRIRLKAFDARDFNSLEKGLRKLPFRAFFDAGSSVRVKVVCHKSRLWHSDAVKERVEGVLKKHVGLKIKNDDSGVSHLIHLRVAEDVVQVSVDASGERMHRRGYRSQVESASLRETLASALLDAAFDKSKKAKAPEWILWDPLCGAGTIVLEALCWAHGLLPGLSRAHAFERFRGHDASAFSKFKESLAQSTKEGAPAPGLRIWGSDQSEKAISAAKANSLASGLDEFATFQVGDILSVASEIPRRALIVTNPPYGKRVADTGAIKKLITLLKKRPDLSPAIVLVGGAARKALPGSAPALFRTKNGGIPVSARLVKG